MLRVLKRKLPTFVLLFAAHFAAATPLFAKPAQPTAEAASSLNIIALVGQCAPEYIVSIKLFPATKRVHYQLYYYDETSELSRIQFQMEAHIPLNMVSSDGCA